MPNRIVRDAILTSERVCSLGWPEEVFYRRLMSIADDYGRTEASVQLLRSRCYPLQTDSVRTADISRWMAACQKAGLILCYEVSGKQYLQIDRFGQQQRSASKCPAPPDAASNCNQMLASDRLGVSVSVVVSEVEGGNSSEPVGSPPAPSGFAIPLNDGTEWAIPLATVEEWTKAYPAVDVPQELREMRTWANANPAKRKTSRGVAAFAVRWLGKAQDSPSRALSRPIQTITVPGPKERDPALVKLDQDAARVRPPSLADLERLAKLRAAA